MAKWIATSFGLGYLPIASGTWGSLGGIAFYLAIEPVCTRLVGVIRPSWFPALLTFFAAMVLVNLLVAGLGVWAATRMARHWRSKDPREVVIDEVSGQLIACLALGPLSWPYLVASFFLFRIFDIWKPFPARQAEALPEGWGIMADDWVAGAYAAVALYLFALLRPILFG